MADEIEVHVEAPSEPTPDPEPVVNPEPMFAAGQATVRAEVAEGRAEEALQAAEDAQGEARNIADWLGALERTVAEVRETAERAEVLALAAAAAWAEDQEEDAEERTEDEGSADAGPDVAPLPDVPARAEDRPHWSRRQRPWVKLGGDAR